MTTSSEAVRRMEWHAGFAERPDGATAATSISDATWPAAGASDRVVEGVDDFLAALSELNRELNGDVPSEIIGGKAEGIPRGAAYAVGELVRMLRGAAESAASPDVTERILDAVWAIEVAWHAVLAGDIDDLQEHLAEVRPWR